MAASSRCAPSARPRPPMPQYMNRSPSQTQYTPARQFGTSAFGQSAKRYDAPVASAAAASSSIPGTDAPPVDTATSVHRMYQISEPCFYAPAQLHLLASQRLKRGDNRLHRPVVVV